MTQPLKSGPARGVPKVQDLGPRVKILLADDSVTMHRAVSLGLKNEPFEVITCDNGQDALRLAIEHHPAVVLADLDMPGLTGIELCQALRRTPQIAQVKVVLLCGSFDQVDESRLNLAQADGRLWKPFESQALIALLKTLLKGGVNVRQSADPTMPNLAPKSPPPAQKKPELRTPEPVVQAPWVDIDEEALVAELEPETSAQPTVDVARDLTELTFREASSQVENTREPSVDSSLRKTAEILIPKGSAESSKQNKLARPNLLRESDETEGLPEITQDSAASNLWSTDFEPELPSPMVSERGSSSLEKFPVYDRNDIGAGGEFEIVTGSMELSVEEDELPPPLPQPDELPLSIPMPPSPDDFGIGLSPQELLFHPLSIESEIPKTPEGNFTEPEAWSADTDFSNFRKERFVGNAQAPRVPEWVPPPQPESEPAPETSHMSEEQIRLIIRDEIHLAIRQGLKQILEDQLKKVMAEISRE